MTKFSWRYFNSCNHYYFLLCFRIKPSKDRSISFCEPWVLSLSKNNSVWAMDNMSSLRRTRVYFPPSRVRLDWCSDTSHTTNFLWIEWHNCYCHLYHCHGRGLKISIRWVFGQPKASNHLEHYKYIVTKLEGPSAITLEGQFLCVERIAFGQKKKLCLVPVTCLKILGSVGRKNLFFFFFFFKEVMTKLFSTNFASFTSK